MQKFNSSQTIFFRTKNDTKSHGDYFRNSSNNFHNKLSKKPVQLTTNHISTLFKEIPPNLTKSYMSRNSYYYDTKVWKQRQQTGKGIIRSKTPKLSKSNISLINSTLQHKKEIMSPKSIAKPNKEYYNSIISKSQLKEILAYDNSKHPNKEIINNDRQNLYNNYKPDEKKHPYSDRYQFKLAPKQITKQDNSNETYTREYLQKLLNFRSDEKDNIYHKDFGCIPK